MATEIPDLVRRSLATWRKRLLDLSKRNSLLYYRRTKSNSLGIATPDIFAVADALDEDGQGWTVQLPPEEADEDLGDDQVDLDEAAEVAKGPQQLSLIPTNDTAEQAPGIGERPRGVLVFDEPNRKTVEKRLRNLMRRSETDLNERGVHILYVAAGFLDWRDPNSKEMVRSPLLLFPVILERESLFDPWRVTPAEGEEFLVNPALLQKMSHDFRLSLPDLAGEGVDRSEGGELCRWYFQSLRNTLERAPIREWKLVEEGTLDLFTFHKLVMYRDLEQNASRAGLHGVIRALAGVRDDASAGEGPLPQEADLDGRVHPKDVFHVLDADSSQLAALEAVRTGRSLVLRGPPGTGKSQTISNLIAQALADRKTILFVSEKMAALEVVKKRLTKAHLGELCLELHSHKTNRRLVVEQLNRALDERLAPDHGALPSEEDFARLDVRREQLQQYVQQLHRRREPLGRSVAAALGELAQLEGAPLKVLPDQRAIAEMRPATWVKLQELVHSIAARWPIVTAGISHPWHGLRATSLGFQLLPTLREELHVVANVLDELERTATQIAGVLGVDDPRSAHDIPSLLTIVTVVERSPAVPRALLERCRSVDTVIGQGRTLTNQWKTARSLARTYFGDAEPAVLPSLSSVRSAATVVAHGLAQINVATVPNPSDVAERARQCESLARAAIGLESRSESLQGFLGLSVPIVSLNKLAALGGIVRQILEGAPFPASFFTAEGHAAAKSRLEQRSDAWTKAALAKTRVLQMFDESVFDLDLKTLLESFRSRYRGVVRYFLASYYRDRRTLSQKAHEPLPSSQLLAEVEKARSAQIALKEVAHGLPDDRRVFGNLAKGIHSDSDLIRRLLARSAEILEAAPQWPLPETLLTILCSHGLLSPAVRAACADFLGAWEVLETSCRDLGLSVDSGHPDRDDVQLPSLTINAEAAAVGLKQALVLLQPLYAATVDPTWDRIAGALDTVEKRNALGRAVADFGHAHASILGADYLGTDTDWDKLNAKVTYACELTDLTVSPLPARLLDIIESPSPRVAGSGTLRDSFTAFNDAVAAVAHRFIVGVQSAPSTWQSMPYSDVRESLNRLEDGLKDVDDVLALDDAKEQLRHLGFLSHVSTLLDGRLTGDAFRAGSRRSILQAWVDIQAQKAPCLGSFRGRDHQAAIEDFRQLDTRLIQAAPHRIMERAGDRTSSGTAGEVGLIRREAAKKRRHIPLRRLFAEAPTVIPRLKPCLLMSPLSVAQFLKDSPIAFDIVVFDEASQIFPEDGIGAIMRGRQIAIAGDDKQLPPTSFFQAAILGEFDEDEEDSEGNEQADYASILDACGITLPRAMLRWHYRSRHESLITFSNARFYESRLITFPSAYEGSAHMGVTWESVPDGVYDRGKSRTNTREAERIVELIVDHWQHRPDESLGVVTLSQAQMERLDDLLQARIIREPELEAFYRDEGDEAFFVKNLENVQGDERDRIILGIGYGKDMRGIITTGFGPLNRSGGERRLNVAITRAKRELTLVASFRYSDLQTTATSPPGVLHLQKFLEYAEHGASVLETASASGGDAESPLEESVASFLTSRGFDVEPQLGCSGFRIDIAVRDPAEPGRFLLGVECDGASYHSAATVRDRDRLRQHVLEDLGWRIHRIWGPDWVRNRAAEEERLVQSVNAAKAGPPKRTSAPPPLAQQIVAVRTTAPARQGVGRDSIPSRVFRPGQVVLPAHVKAMAPHLAPAVELAPIIAGLITQENGVCRERAFRLIADAWGVRRIGARIRGNFEAACGRLVQRIGFDGDFMLPIPYVPVVQLPAAGSPAARRFEHVPPGEILSAVTSLLALNGMMAGDELARAVVSLYGESAALRARTWLDSVLEIGISTGRIGRADGRLELLRA